MRRLLRTVDAHWDGLAMTLVVAIIASWFLLAPFTFTSWDGFWLALRLHDWRTVAPAALVAVWSWGLLIGLALWVASRRH